MKILALLLTAVCGLSLGACAGTAKKSAGSCCGDLGQTKACPANDPHCKVKPKAS